MSYIVVRAQIYEDSTGVTRELPIVITDNGALEPLLLFLVEKAHARSFAWMQKLVQGVGLLLDYVQANQHCFDDPKDLFRTFVQRLYSGTIGDNGLDPSGLYWLPRSPIVVNQLVKLLSQFSDWMAGHLGTTPLNPWRQASRYEEILNWAAYHHRRNNTFLGHVNDLGRMAEPARQARHTLLKKSPIIEAEGVKHFPDDRIFDLLFKGFVKPGKTQCNRFDLRLNLKDILITMLMHFGGVRMSEPFHLFVHDVMPDPSTPGSAVVRIYHPVLGAAPKDWIGLNGYPVRCNREAYLKGKYGMRPRTEYFNTDSLHSGWKGGLMESTQYYMYVHWFPSWSGKLFMALWNAYLLQRALKECDHPFVFVSEYGAPYSIDAFKQAYRRAVKRIGLESAKMLGTSPHGHRHAYGQRLADYKIDPVIRRKALHHKSMLSQLVYTEPSIKKVTEALSVANRNLESGESLPLCELSEFGITADNLHYFLSGFHRKR